MIITYSIVILTLVLGYLATITDYSNGRYFNSWKKLFLAVITLFLVGLSIFSEKIKHQSETSKDIIENARFDSLSTKLVLLETQNFKKNSQIRIYQDSISNLSKELQRTNSLLNQNIERQRNLQREDEVLKYIETTLSPIINKLPVHFYDYLITFDNAESGRLFLKMSSVSDEVREKCSILKSLSRDCNPQIKKELDRFFKNNSHLTDCCSTFKILVSGKNELGNTEEERNIDRPEEFKNSIRDLNHLVKFIINWKRNLE